MNDTLRVNKTSDICATRMNEKKFIDIKNEEINDKYHIVTGTFINDIKNVDSFDIDNGNLGNICKEEVNKSIDRVTIDPRDGESWSRGITAKTQGTVWNTKQEDDSIDENEGSEETDLSNTIEEKIEKNEMFKTKLTTDGEEIMPTIVEVKRVTKQS